MAKSLQEIEDYYLTKGLTGEALRKALKEDGEYQEVWKERKKQIRDKL
jgi:predicted DNA-binding protein